MMCERFGSKRERIICVSVCVCVCLRVDACKVRDLSLLKREI